MLCSSRCHAIFFAFYFLVVSFSLIQPGAFVYAHGNHDHGSGTELTAPQIAGLYQAALRSLRSIETTMPNGIPLRSDEVQFFYGGKPYAMSQDAVTAVFAGVLASSEAEVHACSHGDAHVCSSTLKKEVRQSLVQAFKEKISQSKVARFAAELILTLPGLVSQGFYEIGSFYAVGVATLEVIEHTMLPFGGGVLCKLIQAGSFVAAGWVSHACKVAVNPLQGKASLPRRVLVGLRSAKNELYFTHFLTGQIQNTASPHSLAASTVQKHKSFKIELERLNAEFPQSQNLAKNWLATTSSFWGEVKAVPYGGLTMDEHFQSLFETGLDQQEKEWRTHRLTQLLLTLLEAISKVWDDQIVDAAVRLKFSGSEYVRYMKVKSNLGRLGKTIRIFNAQLVSAVANAKNLSADQQTMVARSLKETLYREIIPALDDVNGLFNFEISPSELRQMKHKILSRRLGIESRKHDLCAALIAEASLRTQVTKVETP